MPRVGREVGINKVWGNLISVFFGTTALIRFGLLMQHTRQIAIFSPK
jgi:hypothetical protein